MYLWNEPIKITLNLKDLSQPFSLKKAEIKLTSLEESENVFKRILIETKSKKTNFILRLDKTGPIEITAQFVKKEQTAVTKQIWIVPPSGNIEQDFTVVANQRQEQIITTATHYVCHVELLTGGGSGGKPMECDENTPPLFRYLCPKSDTPFVPEVTGSIEW